MRCRLAVRAGGSVGAAVLILGGAWLSMFAPATAAPTTQTFEFTGAPQTFVVPANVCRATFDAFGAQGGGGGASDVRQGGTALSNRILVAGGGGGADSGAEVGNTGGAGGGLSGGDGTVSGGGVDSGKGGTQSAGGAAGAGDATAAAGQSGSGGAGGESAIFGGGGGGGGLFGGGGGGGGSGFGPAGVAFETGVRSGDGIVTITYDSDAGSCLQPAAVAAEPRFTG